jgi:hypothetical protein
MRRPAERIAGSQGSWQSLGKVERQRRTVAENSGFPNSGFSNKVSYQVIASAIPKLFETRRPCRGQASEFQCRKALHTVN